LTETKKNNNKREMDEMINVSLMPNTKTMDMGVKYGANFIKVAVTEEERITFLADQIVKEVMETNSPVVQRKRTKQIKKFLQTATSVLGTLAAIAPKATLAATTTEIAANVSMNTLTPHMVLQYGLSLAGITVAAGVSLAMIMLAVAGIWSMFRKRQQAQEWSQDVIRGLVQVLVTVPCVTLLYLLATILFTHLPKLL
jgi:hypothetical protein